MENLPYADQNQLLTMASIIGKETAGSGRARRRVGIYHPLAHRYALQTDPTVIYGMGGYTGKLTRRSRDADRINIYTISGLPRALSRCRQEASLKAAAHPAKTPYLYFVADGRGAYVYHKPGQS